MKITLSIIVGLSILISTSCDNSSVSEESIPISEDVVLLNEIFENLAGNGTKFPSFETIEQIVDTGYIAINEFDEIISIDLSFENLRGTIPSKIQELT